MPAEVRAVGLGIALRAAAGPDLAAMDTGFRGRGMTEEEQLDPVRRLGYGGFTWTLTEPDPIRRVAELGDRMKLRFVALCWGGAAGPRRILPRSTHRGGHRRAQGVSDAHLAHGAKF